MYIDVLPLSDTTARLVRAYGEAPCIALPSVLPAPEGGSWAVTELGDYCFSESPRNLPAPDAVCRYAVGEDGSAVLTRAFGRDRTGRHRRYDLDFGAAPEEDLHPVCGNFLEEAVLPDSLRVIGSCAFYNCRRLRTLSVGAGELTVGSDVFLNCFALADLIVRADPEQATGLFALVNNITEAVRALFWCPGEAAPCAGLWYPAYWEDVSCCTPFPGRDIITDSVFWMETSSAQNTTPFSRTATPPRTRISWPCSASTVCAGPGA